MTTSALLRKESKKETKAWWRGLVYWFGYAKVLELFDSRVAEARQSKKKNGPLSYTIYLFFYIIANRNLKKAKIPKEKKQSPQSLLYSKIIKSIDVFSKENSFERIVKITNKISPDLLIDKHNKDKSLILKILLSRADALWKVYDFEASYILLQKMCRIRPKSTLILKELIFLLLQSDEPKYIQSGLNYLETYRRIGLPPMLVDKYKLIEADARIRLYQADKARAILQTLLAHSQSENDASLLMANTHRDDYLIQLKWVNQYLSRFKLAPIKLNHKVSSFTLDNIARDQSFSKGNYLDGPLVSVVMTSYNAEAYIESALNSLLDQSYKNIEIIIVDNFSSDQTAAVIERMAREHSQIRLIKSTKKNEGYIAKITGIQSSVGELVTFHRADDWSHPEKLELQVDILLKNPELICSRSGLIRYNEKCLFNFKPRAAIAGNSAECMLHPSFSSLMFWREKVQSKVGLIDGSLVRSDSELYSKISEVFGRAAVIHLNLPLMIARQHKLSLTSSKLTNQNPQNIYYCKLLKTIEILFKESRYDRIIQHTNKISPNLLIGRRNLNKNLILKIFLFRASALWRVNNFQTSYSLLQNLHTLCPQNLQIVKELFVLLLQSEEPKYIQAGLEFLQIYRKSGDASSMADKYLLIEADALFRLNEVEKSRILLDALLSQKQSKHDATLLMANTYQDNPQSQIFWVNQYLTHFNLEPLKLNFLDKRFDFNNISRAETFSDLEFLNGPLVSIVLTSFNAEEYIEAALKSLINQSYKNIEIVVVDNCSTDQTVAVIERIASEYPNIRLIKSIEKNYAYIAKNIGIQNCSGELVTYHKADDWSHPEKIKLQVEALLRDPELVASRSGLVRFTRNGLFYLKPRAAITNSVEDSILLRPNFSSLMFWREKVTSKIGFFDGTRGGADSEYYSRILANFGRASVVNLNQPLMFARQQENSLNLSRFMVQNTQRVFCQDLIETIDLLFKDNRYERIVHITENISFSSLIDENIEDKNLFLRIMLLRARALWRSNNFTSSYNLLQKLYELRPLNSQIIRELVILLLQSDDTEYIQTGLEYLEIYKNQGLPPLFADKYQLIEADALIRLNKVNSARTILKSLLSQKQSELDATLLLANAYRDNQEAHLKWVNQYLRQFKLESIKLNQADYGFTLDNIGRDESLSNRQFFDGPLVSIVMTSFNAEAYIETALRSLLEQNYKNIEIIIVDDFSSDQTISVIENIASKHSQIKLIKCHKNNGTYIAKNIGIQNSKGELVTCHDADDWSHPEKIKLQVDVLLKNPELVGSRSNLVRFTDNRLFHLRPRVAVASSSSEKCLLHPNFSSLMFWREKVISKVGYFDCVRVGADSEYYSRILAIFGRVSVINLNLPLMFARLHQASLTSSQLIGSGSAGLSKPRRDYHRSFKNWHESRKPLLLPFPLHDLSDFYRPITVRSKSMPSEDYVCNKKMNYDYDVIVASDFRLPGGSSFSNAQEIIAQHRAGYSTGLLQINSSKFNSDYPLNKTIQECLDRKQGELIDIEHLEKAISCKLLIIRCPEVIEKMSDLVNKIMPKQVAVLVNQSPEDATQQIIYYDPEKLNWILQETFQVEPIWHPVGPLVRKVMAKYENVLSLSSNDWFNIIDFEAWKYIRGGYVSDRPVIGRISGPDRLKWPCELDLNLIYPFSEASGIDVRVLGDIDTPMEILGSIPSHWKCYGYGEISARNFLRQIDFYVYFHHPNMIESFGRSIIEAMASGALVILPQHFSELFGNAAIYAEPKNVLKTISDFYSNWDAYEDQIERGYQFVQQNCSPKNHLKKIESYLNDLKDYNLTALSLDNISMPTLEAASRVNNEARIL